MTDTRTDGPAPTDALRPARGYIRSLDGLRAFAVFSVLASHAGLPHTSGGKTGVLLFFVISGFVITSILLRDLDGRGRLRIGVFYARRAVRLLPALLLATAAYAAVSQFLISGTSLSTQTLLALPSALFYYLNWYDITQGVHSGVGFLGHYWSLSVEEQFYIFWPFLLFIAYRVKQAKGVMWIAVVGAALSYAIKWFIVADGHRQTGTDFAADALLIGCAIAAGRIAYKPRWAVPGATPLLALLVLLGALALGDSSSSASAVQNALYARLWWPLAIVASGVLIWACVVGLLVRPLRIVLEWWPVVYLGRISYGIYLWHILAIYVVTDQLYLTGVTRFVAILVLSTAVAAVSFKLLETPFLRLKPGGPSAASLESSASRNALPTCSVGDDSDGRPSGEAAEGHGAGARGDSERGGRG